MVSVDMRSSCLSLRQRCIGRASIRNTNTRPSLVYNDQETAAPRQLRSSDADHIYCGRLLYPYPPCIDTTVHPQHRYREWLVTLLQHPLVQYRVGLVSFRNRSSPSVVIDISAHARATFKAQPPTPPRSPPRTSPLTHSIFLGRADRTLDYSS